MTTYNTFPQEVNSFLQSKDFVWYYTRNNSTIYFNNDLQDLLGYKGVIISDDGCSKPDFPNKVDVIYENDVLLASREVTRLQSHNSFIQFRVKNSDGKWLSFMTKIELVNSDIDNVIFCGKAIHTIEVDFNSDYEGNQDFFYKLYLENLINSLPVAVFSKDPKEHRYITWNHAMAELTGIPREEAIGKTDFEIYNDEDAKSYIDGDLEVLKSKDSVVLEEKFWNRRNEKKSVKIIKVPNLSRNNEIEFIIGICVDLTIEKEHENKLALSENRYRTLLEALNMRIVLKDMANNIILSNSAYYKSLGYSREQFYRMSALELVHPEDLDYYLAIRDDLTKQDSISYEYRVRHQKGYWQDMLAKSILIKNPDGSPKHLLLIIHDITERKFREKVLRENQLFLQTMIDNLPVSIFVKRVDTGKYEIWNSEAERLTGITKEEAIGRTNKDIFPPDFTALFDSTDEIVFNTAKPYRIGEEKIKMLNLNNRFLNTNKIPIIEKGKVEYILIMTHDVTKTKNSELELKKALEKAKESDRLKAAFINNISHEIRTPLNAIIGSANLLGQSELDNEEKEDYIDIMNQSSQKLLQMISDIMDISRIETNQFDINLTDVNVNQILESLDKCVHNLANDLDKTYIKSHVRKHPEKSKTLYTDSIRITQIFQYLTSNAIKFTPTGEVEFGYFDENDSEIIFYVKDTGIGIPGSMHKAIFEKFFQLEMSLTKVYSGLGIGLYLTKSILNLLGGRIWLESEVNNGSTFYFSLKKKITDKNKDSIKTKSNSGREFNWNGKTIMVVDDTRSTTTLLKKLLEKNGASVVTANSGMEAIEILKNSSLIDLVLLDLQMPVLSGAETAEEMHKVKPELKIIAQSAYTLEEDREFVENVNFAAYLTKPIITKEMYKIVDVYLRN